MVATGDPPVPTPAELLELLQQDRSILDHFEDDPELRTLAEALLEGWEKPELLSLFDNDATKYNTTRKRYRRRIDKLLAALPRSGGPHDQDRARETDDC